MSDKEEYVGWLSDEWNEVLDMRQPIVRCRDCKYYESVPEDSGDWCGYWTDRIYVDARGSGFCVWGVRQEK